jgi:hypothetical protein
MADDIKKQLVQRATLAAKAKRFVDMATAMKHMTELDVELSREERNLLAGAYEKVVGAQRESWRTISLSEQSEEIQWKSAAAKSYKQKVEKELRDTCSDILGLLGNHLLIKASNPEAQVFYYTLQGDYLRYLAEVTTGDPRNDAMEDCQEAYQEAYDIAHCQLHPTHPIRLRLAFNFSTFFYEVRDSPKEASLLAKRAYTAAIAELNTIDKDSYREFILIMHQLRENFTTWISDSSEGDAGSASAEGKDNEPNPLGRREGPACDHPFHGGAGKA